MAVEEIIHILVYGTENEKETVLAIMVHDLNAKLDRLYKTLKELDK